MAVEAENEPSAGGSIPASDPESEKNMASTCPHDEAVRVWEDLSTAPDRHHALHRGLKSRHVAMIAIGGSIGYENEFHQKTWS